MDAIDILGIICMVFNYLILCPILVFSSWKFCKVDSEESLKKFRSKPLVCILNMMMLFTLLVERLYANCVGVWRLLPLNWIYYFVFSISWWSAFFLFCIKTWHLYYKQKYSMKVADIAWKSDINPNEQNNFYLINSATFGNPVYCVKILLVPFLIFVLLNTSISAIYGESLVLDFTQFILASIPIIASFVIFYKSRKLRDIYKHRNEIFYQCIVIIIALSIYLGAFLFLQVNQKWRNDPNAIRIQWLFQNIVADLCAIGLAIIPAAYPVYLYYYLGYDTYYVRSITNRMRSASVDTEKEQSVQSVMAESDSFKSFLFHLVSEFNTENLLFLVELIQIKHAFYASQNSNTGDAEDIDGDDTDNICCTIHANSGQIQVKLQIPTDIPKSIILSQHDTLKRQFETLYSKYIQNGSAHEVNVSGPTRDRLWEIFEPIKENDAENELPDDTLVNIMDTAAYEIYLLLQDPFGRFKHTFY